MSIDFEQSAFLNLLHKSKCMGSIKKNNVKHNNSMDNNYSPSTYFRDIIVLIALGMLLGIAFKRHHRIKKATPTAPAYAANETSSTHEQAQKAETPATSDVLVESASEPAALPYPFEVHELDQAFLSQIHDTLAQATKLQTLAAQKISLDRVSTQRLDRILQSIQEIKNNYSQNSPAIALLGPLGSTAIVIKEKKLSEQLLHEINRLGALLVEIKNTKNNTTTRFTDSPYIKTGLEFNNKILNEL